MVAAAGYLAIFVTAIVMANSQEIVTDTNRK